MDRALKGDSKSGDRKEPGRHDHQNPRACRRSGQPCAVRADAGQRGEITGAEKLIEGLPLGALLADKAYDADHFRDLLKSKGVEAVIPARKVYCGTVLRQPTALIQAAKDSSPTFALATRS